MLRILFKDFTSKILNVTYNKILQYWEMKAFGLEKYNYGMYVHNLACNTPLDKPILTQYG